MKTSIIVSIAIIGSAVAIGVGFLIGFCVRDMVKPDMDHMRVKRAVCTFGVQSQVKGYITLTEEGPDGVNMAVNVSGVDGRHGIHIHQNGDLGNECKAAKGHYNPERRAHGGPTETER